MSAVLNKVPLLKLRRGAGEVVQLNISRWFVMAALILSLTVGVQAETLTGLDVLVRDKFKALAGKRVGVITNHTGRDRKGRPIVDLFREATGGVKLAAVFSPEHGFTGKAEHGKRVKNASLDGVPLYSLYGDTKRPTPEMLKDIDALVFDIQDIGTRFYTYITTLGYALEEAAKAGVEFYVLDRPNPVNGKIIEGFPLEDDVRHFTAYFSIPVRHGMTVGEIARWHDAKAGLNAKLAVISMEGWNRGWYDETKLKFVPTSPNIRALTAALLYPGVGAFEATNVSVGRGTPTPFEIFGAPWLNAGSLADHLNGAGLAGLRFESASFIPSGDNLYTGQPCRGVRVAVTDRDAARPVEAFLRAAVWMRDRHPDDFAPRWEEVPYVSARAFETLYKSSATADDIVGRARAGAAAFKETRAPFLLYPERIP